MYVKLRFILLGGRTVTVRLDINRYFHILDRHLSVAVRRRWERELNPFGDHPHTGQQGGHITYLWKAMCRAGEASVSIFEQETLWEYPVRCYIEVHDEASVQGCPFGCFRGIHRNN